MPRAALCSLLSVCSWFGVWLRCHGTALQPCTNAWFGHFSWNTKLPWTTWSTIWGPRLRTWLTPSQRRVRYKLCTYKYSHIDILYVLQQQFLKFDKHQCYLTYKVGQYHRKSHSVLLNTPLNKNICLKVTLFSVICSEKQNIRNSE